MLPGLLAAFIFFGCSKEKRLSSGLHRLDYDVFDNIVNDISGTFLNATYSINNKPSQSGTNINYDTFPSYICRPDIRSKLYDSLIPEEAYRDIVGKNFYEKNDSCLRFFLSDVFNTGSPLYSEFQSVIDTLARIYTRGEMFAARGIASYAFVFVTDTNEQYITITLRLSVGSRIKKLGEVTETVYGRGYSSSVATSLYLFRQAYICEISHLIVDKQPKNMSKDYKEITHPYFPTKKCWYLKKKIQSQTQFLKNAPFAFMTVLG